VRSYVAKLEKIISGIQLFARDPKTAAFDSMAVQCISKSFALARAALLLERTVCSYVTVVSAYRTDASALSCRVPRRIKVVQACAGVLKGSLVLRCRICVATERVTRETSTAAPTADAGRVFRIVRSSGSGRTPGISRNRDCAELARRRLAHRRQPHHPSRVAFFRAVRKQKPGVA